MISASALARAVACIASVTHKQHRSPPSDHARRGTAIHRYVELALTIGRAAALAQVPEEFREDCEAFDPLAFFDAEAKVQCELPVAYDHRTDVARVLRGAHHRDYSGAREGETPGTLDMVETWGSPVTRARLSDLKTGHEQVSADTLQLAAYGLMVARLYDLQSVEVRIVQVAEDGSARLETRTLDEFDLLETAGIVGATLTRAEVAAAAKLVGIEPEENPGEHCRWCPALASCHTYTGLASTMLAEWPSNDPRAVVKGMTLAQVAEAALKFRRLKKLLELVGPAINARIDAEGRVPLGDGTELVANDSTVRSVDGRVALRVLRERYGEKANDLPARITLKAVEDAFGEDGINLIGVGGAIRSTSITRHTVRKIKAAG